MSEVNEKLQKFVDYRKILKGDEKGEAQVFCDRLFQAFGHEGYKEAGAELEYRVKGKTDKGTSFADLVWKPRMLLEMKKSGTNLFLHYKQAFNYWINAVPNRPRYVVLCNFDEFWIYDFDKQVGEPVDIVKIDGLTLRYSALNFLFPSNPKPVFGNDLEAVSRDAADKVALLFNMLTDRDVDRVEAQRFVLQVVVAMFAEDTALLPANIVSNLVNDCLHNGQNAYDLFGGLFKQMNSKAPAKGGRYQNVPYFNGGIFQTINPIELLPPELEIIGGEDGVARKDWSKINPAIFGTIFQQSMDKAERHAHGAHFTSEADIMRIVNPTITQPWRQKIKAASSMKDLLALRGKLMSFKVLDPACGSGNFLYLAYRELVRIEIELLSKLKEVASAKNFNEHAKTISLVSPRQFYGIDRDSFGVELAKMTLMLAKKLALDEVVEIMKREELELALHGDDALPLDNLDDNILCEDALFVDWPTVDAIIGNPPYQSKNKMTQELGKAYVNRVREKMPDIPHRADYCVYWFRKAHDHLDPGQRAGLVGTNTIRQNYSRLGGLDYIVSNGGTITEAISTQIWSGEAAVHVSIVNWVKGAEKGPKKLFRQIIDQEDLPWEVVEKERIGPSLSFEIDVSEAKSIKANASSTACYQGQTHGHKGFLLSVEEAQQKIAADKKLKPYLHPYMIATDLIATPDGLPSRYVIDFEDLDLLAVQEFPSAYEILEKQVRQARVKSASKEKELNAEALEADEKAEVARDHARALEEWWLLFRRRGELLSRIAQLDRYIVCGRVTKRPIFEFVSSDIRPNDSMIAFPLDDDYSYGILQSGIHWAWFTVRCSTLGPTPRYTSNTVFDSFPWPQTPTLKAVKDVAAAAVKLRLLRRELKHQYNLSFRRLYQKIEGPGKSPLKDAHKNLDQAARAAYGMKKSGDPLAFLLNLNRIVADKEDAGQEIVGPGLPPVAAKNKLKLVTSDCIGL